MSESCVVWLFFNYSSIFSFSSKFWDDGQFLIFIFFAFLLIQNVSSGQTLPGLVPLYLTLKDCGKMQESRGTLAKKPAPDYFLWAMKFCHFPLGELMNNIYREWYCMVCTQRILRVSFSMISSSSKQQELYFHVCG